MSTPDVLATASALWVIAAVILAASGVGVGTRHLDARRDRMGLCLVAASALAAFAALATMVAAILST